MLTRDGLTSVAPNCPATGCYFLDAEGGAVRSAQCPGVGDMSSRRTPPRVISAWCNHALRKGLAFNVAEATYFAMGDTPCASITKRLPPANDKVARGREGDPISHTSDPAFG